MQHGPVHRVLRAATRESFFPHPTLPPPAPARLCAGFNISLGVLCKQTRCCDIRIFQSREIIAPALPIVREAQIRSLPWARTSETTPCSDPTPRLFKIFAYGIERWVTNSTVQPLDSALSQLNPLSLTWFSSKEPSSVAPLHGDQDRAGDLNRLHLTHGIGVKLSALHVRENIFWKQIMVRWRAIRIHFINFPTSVFVFTAMWLQRLFFNTLLPGPAWIFQSPALLQPT
jgi:hypothetical protein